MPEHFDDENRIPVFINQYWTCVVADFCGILKCKLQDPAVNKFTQSILKFVSLANDITNGYFYSFYILRFIIAKYNISYTWMSWFSIF